MKRLIQWGRELINRALRKIRKWLNKSKFVLAIITLAIGISGTIIYYEGLELKREYNQAIRIFENLHYNVEPVKADSPVEPKGEAEQVSASAEGTFYSYNAEEGQTDGNPTITASSQEVREGIVANNCLEFGTKIEVDGIGILEVQDRMNSRYGCEVFDIFMWDKNESLQFGKKQLTYLIL